MRGIHGLLLPGGQDIQPIFYGQLPHEKTEQTEEKPGNKAAYAAVPFTALLDIVTAPFLGLYALILTMSGFKG